MDDQKRRDDGMAQRRKVLGDAWVDKSMANRNSFNAEFLDLITRHAWGEIWTRPHFDERTRRVLVIGTMVALGQWDEFRLHVRAALQQGGFTPDDSNSPLVACVVDASLERHLPGSVGRISPCSSQNQLGAVQARLSDMRNRQSDEL